MTSREILYANLDHTGPDRPGLNFDNGRLDDMNIVWAGYPDGYIQKRWREGTQEFYDDMWGNLWVQPQWDNWGYEAVLEYCGNPRS